jgi:hypothetical protein
MVNEIKTVANRRLCPELPLSGAGKHPDFQG